MGSKSITVSVKGALIKGDPKLDPGPSKAWQWVHRVGLEYYTYPWEGWGHCLGVKAS